LPPAPINLIYGTTAPGGDQLFLHSAHSLQQIRLKHRTLQKKPQRVGSLNMLHTTLSSLPFYGGTFTCFPASYPGLFMAGGVLEKCFETALFPTMVVPGSDNNNASSLHVSPFRGDA